jgi:hypothetical protein
MSGTGVGAPTPRSTSTEPATTISATSIPTFHM